MKAEKYRVKISIDTVHKWGDRLIDEIFIPELKLVINSEGFAFASDERRGQVDVKEIEVDDEDCRILQQYVEAQKEIEEIKNKLF